ncbi:MAG: lipid-binding SYLF domain-containing protein [Planctomycetota bacterium]|nr:lipid-binding SYLF domain-containing protein [Planctomycetota bacterium]MDA1180511.1 lipid-binding SYLF domain-containing protein [Planctomycetota bacterium]
MTNRVILAMNFILNSCHVVRIWIAVCAVVGWGANNLIYGQLREELILRESSQVLSEVMAIPLREIPESLLADAYGIAIVPKVLKGSFVIGARHGNGVLLIRDDNDQWRAPLFISLTGGNIGWQVGVQSTDVVLVFRTPESVEGIISGKFTLGADAAVAAGPVGRNASAATDARLAAEILSYSRSRGLFAGVSLDGTVLSVDQLANAAYYTSPRPGQPATVPPAAANLIQQVARFAETEPLHAAQQDSRPRDDSDLSPPETGFSTTDDRFPAAAADAASETLAPESKSSQQDATILRGQLVNSLAKLNAILDPTWRSYLAMPATFEASEAPDPMALEKSLQRFDTIRRDVRYQQLSSRPDFQTAYALLRQYVTVVRHERGELQLPPPPIE